MTQPYFVHARNTVSRKAIIRIEGLDRADDRLLVYLHNDRLAVINREDRERFISWYEAAPKSDSDPRQLKFDFERE